VPSSTAFLENPKKEKLTAKEPDQDCWGTKNVCASPNIMNLEDWGDQVFIEV